MKYYIIFLFKDILNSDFTFMDKLLIPYFPAYRCRIPVLRNDV